MRLSCRPLVLLVSPLLLLALAPAAALADDVRCSKRRGLIRGELNANLVVDRDCRIDDAFVNGNVKWRGRHFLEITDSEVNGNLECNGKGTVAISNSEINGNIVECRREVHDHDKPWPPPYKGVAFEAGLQGLQEVPAVSSSGRGSFKAEIDREGMLLRYALRYEDLEGGDVLFSHIHFGKAGTNGGVIAFLCSNTPPPVGVETPPCPAEGEVLEGELDGLDVIGPADQGIEPGESREALRALLEGAGYVNLHTDGFPTGELRGQIEAQTRGKKKKRR